MPRPATACSRTSRRWRRQPSSVRSASLFYQASLGGLNIVVHWLQERFGWRAGYLQLAIDLAIIAASLAMLPLERILVSLFGAATLNLTLAINHRPGRYMAA